VSDYSVLKGFAKLSSCIVKGYSPCPTCCTTAWNNALVERNADIVKRSDGYYFYFKNSSTFHLSTCRCILQAKKEFHHAAKYPICDDPRIYDLLVHAWFVLIGYGGRPSNGVDPVQMKEGYSLELLRNHEQYGFRIPESRHLFAKLFLSVCGVTCLVIVVLFRYLRKFAS